jgi:hypothetical protein
MRLRVTVFAAIGALMLGSLALPAAAAPAVGTDLKTATTESSSFDRVNYRRCWRHNGHLHCRYRRYGYAPYYDDGYYGYGYGPSVGLYFGGGGGHFRHGGHRR